MLKILVIPELKLEIKKVQNYLIFFWMFVTFGKESVKKNVKIGGKCYEALYKQKKRKENNKNIKYKCSKKEE